MNPTAPQNVAIALNKTHPVLSWSPQADATGFEIELLLPGDTAYTLRAGYGSRVRLDGASTTWTDNQYSTLAPTCRQYGGTLQYRMRAINGSERSEWVNAKPVTLSTTMGVWKPTPMADVIAYACSSGHGRVIKVTLKDDGTAIVEGSVTIPKAAVCARYGDYLLVADYRDILDGTFTVLDSALNVVGSFSDPRIAYATGIEVVGPIAVVASQTFGDGVIQGPGALTTVDLYDLTTPRVINTTMPNETYLAHPFGTARWNKYVFAAGNGNQRLCVVDVRNQFLPKYVAAHQVAALGEGHQALAISYPYLFASHDCGSIVCYDIRNPIDPRAIGQIGDKQALGNALSIRLTFTTLHCVTESGYYTQVDVGDPTAPRIIRSTNLGFSPFDIQIVGNLAWVSGHQTLTAFNVRDGQPFKSNAINSISGHGQLIV
jgi:hypothetical protein